MAFTSFAFLGFFLVVAGVYWSLPQHRLRMGWLLLASAAYYMTWNPWLITLILFSASVDYAAALALERTASPWRRWWLVVGSVTVNLGLLCYFKYVNFFLDSVAWGLWGVTAQRTAELVLPLGISFYTFETISYIVDVYARRTRAVSNPLDYALFILFFPHLMAGPIVRANHFLPQLDRPKRWNWDRASLGVRLIVRGLFLKAILADHLGKVVEPVFADPASYSSAAVWLAVLGYAVQIFGDFAGYSDMALGLAHLLDFRLPLNFNNPYLAASPAEFWRRWHISLSTWLRDYVFIPLGGSRWGVLATCRNLLLVMLLGGLWHGAGWTFLAWGAYHGLLLAGHRLIRWPAWLSSSAARPLCVLGTFVLVCFGWVLFRATTFGVAGEMLTRLVIPTAGLTLSLAGMQLVLLGVGFVFVAGLVAEARLVERWEKQAPEALVGGTLAAALTLILLLWPESMQTFIYFQF